MDGGDGPGLRARLVRVGLVAALAGAVALPMGWAVSDVLERDNDFCNACHLKPGLPLHRDLRRDFDSRPVASLAALHADAAFEDRTDGFRCIDCHGGVSWLGRARVKILAGKDAFWYVVGHFDEPSAMRWPLWDEDCVQCHAAFDEGDIAEWESPRFHQIPLHNVELGVDCVECHQVHLPGGQPDAHFLQTDHVRGQCARCHAEYETLEPRTGEPGT